MSADDWVECPFCKKERENLLNELFKKLPRKKYERLFELVRKHNINIKGIYYIIDNGYLESDELPDIDIESDMTVYTMRIDYEYDINEKECYFVILFECEICVWRNCGGQAPAMPPRLLSWDIRAIPDCSLPGHAPTSPSRSRHVGPPATPLRGPQPPSDTARTTSGREPGGTS